MNDITQKFDHRIKNPDPHIVALLAEIDGIRGEFKGGLRMTPQAVTNLKRSTLITSAGASTRIEGAKLNDEEVEKVMRGLAVSLLGSIMISTDILLLVYSVRNIVVDRSKRIIDADVFIKIQDELLKEKEMYRDRLGVLEGKSDKFVQKFNELLDFTDHADTVFRTSGMHQKRTLMKLCFEGFSVKNQKLTPIWTPVFDVLMDLQVSMIEPPKPTKGLKSLVNSMVQTWKSGGVYWTKFEIISGKIRRILTNDTCASAALDKLARGKTKKFPIIFICDSPHTPRRGAEHLKGRKFLVLPPPLHSSKRLISIV